MTLKIFLSLGAAIILVGIIATPILRNMPSQPMRAAGAEHTEMPVPAPPAPQPAVARKPPDLELVELEGFRTEIGGRIEGRVRNNTQKAYRYAQVTFTLYNAADELVGTALATAGGLEPGDIWRFEAMVLQRDWERFELDKIAGF